MVRVAVVTPSMEADVAPAVGAAEVAPEVPVVESDAGVSGGSEVAASAPSELAAVRSETSELTAARPWSGSADGAVTRISR